MSMRSYFVNGFGFETSDIKDANILKFIRDHADKCPDFSEDDITVLKTYSNKQINSIARKDPYFLSSLIDEIDEKLARMLEPLRKEYPNMIDTVAKIISDETSINMIYTPGQQGEGCIGDECIMLEYKLPWEYNEKERNCTQDDLVNILKPYLKELGLKVDCLTDLEVEYYG